VSRCFQAHGDAMNACKENAKCLMQQMRQQQECARKCGKP
jgi:hypothetical protein